VEFYFAWYKIETNVVCIIISYACNSYSVGRTALASFQNCNQNLGSLVSLMREQEKAERKGVRQFNINEMMK